jgi:hypothetical protein
VRWCVDGSDYELVDIMAQLLRCQWQSMWGSRVVEKLVSSDQCGFVCRSRRWSHNHGGHALALCRCYGMDHSHANGATAGMSRLSRPGAGSGLSLSPLLSAKGMRGGSRGVNVHRGDDAGTPRTTKSPLPSRPNVEVVLRHFHRHCSRVARYGSLFGGA